MTARPEPVAARIKFETVERDFTLDELGFKPQDRPTPEQIKAAAEREATYLVPEAEIEVEERSNG